VNQSTATLSDVIALIESEVGKGTVFFVEMTLSEVEAGVIPD
jgi:hypothetical protein